MPLYILDSRWQWLLSERLITFVDRDIDSFTVRATAPWGLALDFKLIRERPEGADTKMWAVLYCSADRQSARGLAAAGQWTPVMAMRDPMCELPVWHYRSATTGDYDLFAVWARKADYSPDLQDRRMVSHASLEAAIRARAVVTGEDMQLGNITHRLRMVRDRLNAAFKRRGYLGGNMVHHSDEGGAIVCRGHRSARVRGGAWSRQMLCPGVCL